MLSSSRRVSSLYSAKSFVLSLSLSKFKLLSHPRTFLACNFVLFCAPSLWLLMLYADSGIKHFIHEHSICVWIITSTFTRTLIRPQNAVKKKIHRFPPSLLFSGCFTDGENSIDRDFSSVKKERRTHQGVINLISEMNFDILLRQWTRKTISTLQLAFLFRFGLFFPSLLSVHLMMN